MSPDRPIRAGAPPAHTGRPARHPAALALVLLAACAAPPEPVATPPLAAAEEAAGLDFVHFNGMTGDYLFHEIAGAGAALFDYDGDGDLDVYLLQGHLLGEGTSLEDALFPPAPGTPLSDRLFRNDLTVEAGGRRLLRFTDVTAASGIVAPGYGMGVAAGDYDNDGDVDLYVTNFGANQLWRNGGDGSFEEVTAASGSDDRRWSTSAAFVDVDRDGWLDLFIANYVDYGPAMRKPCLSATGAREYCGPQGYQPEHDRLLRNRGDGTFEDISLAAGILAERGSGLGVVTADLDGDGWIDIYVANDLMRNHLWMNGGRGEGGGVRFTNEALYAGCAVDVQGRAQASMGVDAGDLDNDGDDDLFMTHLDNETSTIYWNQGGGLFRDGTADTRLGAPSIGFTGFGTAMFDLDNDGWLDIVVANGAVKSIPGLAGERYPLHQPNQLFHNRGRADGDSEGASYQEWSDRVPALARSEVSRGIAVGDLDNDGDTDVLIANNSGPARLLRNEVGQAAHWIGLRLLDAAGVRDQLGATATVRTAHGLRRRRVRSDASYCSANDPRVLLGLGAEAAPVSVEVRWVDGRRETWPALAVDRYHTLRAGDGTAAQDGGGGP